MNHNEEHGIYPSSSYFSSFLGNVCCNNDGTGIKGAWEWTKYSSISGNSCHGNTTGITLHGDVDVPPPYYIGPSYNTVLGNNIYNNSRYGIYINELTHNNQLIGNMCYHNGDNIDDQIVINSGCNNNNLADNVTDY